MSLMLLAVGTFLIAKLLAATMSFFFVFTVSQDESSVAPRLSSSCTQKRSTSARTSVLRSVRNEAFP